MRESYYDQIGSDLTSDAVEILRRKVGHIIQTNCLVSMDVKVHKPKSIPRSEGKAVRVIDLRKADTLTKV